MHKPISLLVVALVLGGALWAVYNRAMDSPFLFDDSSSVVKNSSITRLWPLVGDAQRPGPLNPPKNLPTSGRPLVSFSLAVNYYFGGLNPVGYHVFNLIVHLFSALLVMAIVERTLNLEYFEGQFQRAGGPLAFIVALLWALHPLQTEPVVYVTQRTELMVGFFYLAALYCSLRYWAGKSSAAQNPWLALATLACLAGMACKEVMVTAPVVVLLFERTFVSGSFRRALEKSWPLYVALFLCWAFLLYLNYGAPRSGATGFERGISAHQWWLTQTKVLLLYLKLAVWPWPLSIHYEVPYLASLGAAWPWFVPAALLGFATVILLWRRNPIGFVGAWALLILSPTLVVPIVTEVAAERRMYLPLAALIALTVVGGYWLIQRAEQAIPSPLNKKETNRWLSILGAVAALVLATVLGLVGYRRLAAYHDAITLWHDALASQPDDPIVHNNLGASLMIAGRLSEAMVYIQQALQLNPDFAEAHYNFAFALNQAAPQARQQEVIDHYLQALRAKPEFPEAEYNLAVALDHVGKTSEAIEHYRKALSLKPDFPEALNSLGETLSNLGQSSEAIQQLELAIQLNPQFTEAHNNFGIALTRAGRIQEGIEQFQLALKQKPDFAEVHLNLGVALGKAGRLPEGIDQFKETIRLKPDCVDAYANMTRAYALLDRPAEAIATAEKAMALARSLGQVEVAAQIEAWLNEYRLQHAQPTEASKPPANLSSP